MGRDNHDHDAFFRQLHQAGRGFLVILPALLVFVIACTYKYHWFRARSRTISSQEPVRQGVSVHAFHLRVSDMDETYDWEVMPFALVWLGDRADTGCVTADTADTADTASPAASVRFPDWTVLMPCREAWFSDAIYCPGASTCEAWLVFELVSERDLPEEWGWEVQGSASTIPPGCRGDPPAPRVLLEEVDPATVPADQARRITVRAGPAGATRRVPPEPVR